MANKLVLRQYIPLPPHPAGDFDHGDVHLESGRVFVANTAAGTVEVIDGEQLRHLTTIPDCPEASGVLCAKEDALVAHAGLSTTRREIAFWSIYANRPASQCSRQIRSCWLSGSPSGALGRMG